MIIDIDSFLDNILNEEELKSYELENDFLNNNISKSNTSINNISEDNVLKNNILKDNVVVVEENLKNKKIRRSLACSMMDGNFNSAMVGFGESIFSMFAVFMKMSSYQLGLLSSLPNTLGSFFQIFSRSILKLFPSKKSYIVTFAAIQGLCFIPLPFIYFFFRNNAFIYMLFLISLYWINGMMIGPAWTSWMGDLVPSHIRGSYFGKRNAITSMVSFIAMLIGGFILSYYSEKQIIGFTILFLLASFMRFFSIFFILLKDEPLSLNNIHDNVTFKEFMLEADMQNYGIFILIGALMNLSIYIAAPFFVVYMSNDLFFSYTTITILNAIAILVKFLFNPIWGKLCDRFSSQKIFSFCAFLMPATPILWIFSSSLLWIIFIQILSGFAWSGWEVASSNFAYEMVPKNKRVSSVSYLNFFSGIGILIGGLLGGFIITNISVPNEIFFSRYFLVFMVSGILRYGVSIFFITKLKDRKIVEPISSSRLLQTMFDTAFSTGVLNLLVPKKIEMKDNSIIIVNNKDSIEDISKKIDDLKSIKKSDKVLLDEKINKDNDISLVECEISPNLDKESKNEIDDEIIANSDSKI